MRIDVPTSVQPASLQQLPPAAQTLQILAGQLPTTTSVGDTLSATVLDTRGGVTLLDVGNSPNNSQIVVDGLPRLPPGTDLSLKITSLSPNAVVELAANPSPATPALPVTIGEQVVAHLGQQQPNGTFLINVKGVPLEATVPPGLTAGTDIPLVVVQTQPQVVFQILDSTPPPAAQAAQAAQVVLTNFPDRVSVGDSLGALRQAITNATSGSTPAADSLTRLQAAITRLLPPEGASPTADHLASFVRDGGLLLEAKLARAVDTGGSTMAKVAANDVKGLTLQALQDTATAPASARTEALVNALTQHLGTIETQQALNVLAQLHGDAIPLQIPIGSGKDQGTAFLSIEPDASGGSDAQGRPKGFSVLFLLDLENFGKTRIDARFQPGAMSVAFYTESDAALQKVQAGLPAFRRELNAVGYENVTLAARPLSEMSAERRQKLETVVEGVPSGTHLVDRRA